MEIELENTKSGDVAAIRINFAGSAIPHMCEGCKYACENPDPDHKSFTCRRAMKDRIKSVQTQISSVVFTVTTYLENLVNTNNPGPADLIDLLDLLDQYSETTDKLYDSLKMALEYWAYGYSRPGGGVLRSCNSKMLEELEEERKARREKHENPDNGAAEGSREVRTDEG